MSTQRQLTGVGFLPMCVCGSATRAYSTTYDPNGKVPMKFHLECHPCQHITPKLSTLPAATTEFRRMMAVVRLDRQQTNNNQIGVVR